MADLNLLGVKFFDYERESNGILLSSGCGIGMAVMDVCPAFRWFVDIDSYRREAIDWEAIAVVLSCRKPSVIGFVGWFTIDTPSEMNRFSKGVLSGTNYKTYIGGGLQTLDEWISQVNCPTVSPL